MSYSQKWWVIIALLFVFALTVSVLTAQTEEPSAVNAPSRAKVQADSAGAQADSAGAQADSAGAQASSFTELTKRISYDH